MQFSEKSYPNSITALLINCRVCIARQKVLLQNCHSFFRRLAARPTMRDFVFVHLLSLCAICGYLFTWKTIHSIIKE